MFVPSAMFCWAFFPHSWDGGEHLDHYHSASGGACVDGCFRAGKALVAVLVGALVRWPAPGWRASRSQLAHGGKDGLMLLTLAMKAGTIAPEAGQSALLALIATMAIGPILIQQNAKIAQFIGGASRRFREVVYCETVLASASLGRSRRS
jgi:hypothetical protein